MYAPFPSVFHVHRPQQALHVYRRWLFNEPPHHFAVGWGLFRLSPRQRTWSLSSLLSLHCVSTHGPSLVYFENKHSFEGKRETQRGRGVAVIHTIFNAPSKEQPHQRRKHNVRQHNKGREREMHPRMHVCVEIEKTRSSRGAADVVQESNERLRHERALGLLFSHHPHHRRALMRVSTCRQHRGDR